MGSGSKRYYGPSLSERKRKVASKRKRRQESGAPSIAKYVLIGASLIVASNLLISVEDITVIGKERVSVASGGQYRIDTANETLKNTDNWFRLKINSADVQRLIESGHKYRVKLDGFRIPLVSEFRNTLQVLCEHRTDNQQQAYDARVADQGIKKPLKRCPAL